MWRAWVLVGVLTACVDSSSKRCGDVTCSESSVCSPAGDRCVSQAQLDACASAADGAGCSYPGVDEGVCTGQLCVGAGCGNGIVDPRSEERCDDGNRISLDGCSADCRSDERCGDGVADLAVGEYCDCGDGTMAVPGCATANAETSGASCRTDCTLARCGDGVLDPLEQCDDGNNVPGDGCRVDCAGRWTVMASNTYTDLYAIWGTGPTDIFVAGYRRINHYDGASWTSMTLPDPLAYMPQPYKRLWGTSPTDVYALGYNRLDHYDGAMWTPTRDLTTSVPSAISGVSASDFWIGCGDIGTSPGELHHYTGSWAPVDTQTWPVLELAAVASDSVYSIVDYGSNTEPHRLWRYDGASWKPETGTASTDMADALRARHVFALGVDDVYAFDAFGTVTTMRHYNGTAWTSTPCCDEIAGSALAMGGVQGDLLLVGQNGHIMQSADGVNWEISASGVDVSLNAVWSYAPNHAFVVGNNGTILY